MENKNHHCESHKSQDGEVRAWQMVSGVLAIVLIFSVLPDLKGNRAVQDIDTGSSAQYQNQSSGIAPALLADIIPTGIPAVYGAELNIKYDDVSSLDPSAADLAIEKMSKYDLELTLAGENLERYIDILYHQHEGFSCEYCCGAKAIIFENGEMACGCAHSYAMRGLAKYLILNHGEEMTDDQILEELGKWKVLFFPDVHMQKAGVMQSSGIPVNYISLTTNQNRGIEQKGSGASGGMVGGC